MENLQTDNNAKQIDDKKKRRDRVIKTAVVIVGAIILLLLLLAKCGGSPNPGPGPTPTFNVDIDPNATDDPDDTNDNAKLVEELNQQVAEGMINISMNTTPVFADGNSSGNLLIVNEKINRYPQIVEIYRDDTNELIYTSGVIPVGSKIKSAKLDAFLAKGTYPCTAYFHSVDATGNSLGKAGAKIQITVGAIK